MSCSRNQIWAREPRARGPPPTPTHVNEWSHYVSTRNMIRTHDTSIICKWPLLCGNKKTLRESTSSCFLFFSLASQRVLSLNVPRCTSAKLKYISRHKIEVALYCNARQTINKKKCGSSAVRCVRDTLMRRHVIKSTMSWYIMPHDT
jgi:hypothetical protein